MIKTKTLPNLRPAYLMGPVLIAALLLSACTERKADRIAFDGQFFRTSSKKLDKDRMDFEVTVRGASASIEGAVAAGEYEATRYCIGNFGTSNVAWINGPDGGDGRLSVSNDRLVLTGTCSPQ